MDTFDQRNTVSLEQMSRAALQRDATEPAVEFEKRWVTRGELRRLAEQLEALIDARGAGPSPKVAFIARNHPSALAALLALLARRCSVRMIYPFQSPVGISHSLADCRAAKRAPSK